MTAQHDRLAWTCYASDARDGTEPVHYATHPMNEHKASIVVPLALLAERGHAEVARRFHDSQTHGSVAVARVTIGALTRGFGKANAFSRVGGDELWKDGFWKEAVATGASFDIETDSWSIVFRGPNLPECPRGARPNMLAPTPVEWRLGITELAKYLGVEV